jgi:signal transduction histidine kinase
MEMSRFDVLDVLTELHREAAMVTPEDTFTLSPTVSCEIEADRSMVKQVLRILCDNAVKYTPKGGSITLGVTHEPGWCTLSVTDNGPGISSDELPLIFDRFYRSDSARKSEGGGHGLGLSIARIIVIAHGGRLRVRSKVGSGTTFYVVLPEKQPQLHNNAGSAPSKPAAT